MESPTKVDVITIHTVPISNLGESEFLDYFQEIIRSSTQRVIFFANAHSCNVAQGDKQFLAALREADLVLPDGMGIKIAGKFIGHPIKDNLNGTDLLPKVLSMAANQGLGVFFLGGDPGVAEEAREEILKNNPLLRVVGVHHGFFSGEEQRDVIEKINASEADLLIVGLGVPLQEKWIVQCRYLLRAKVLFGVGAFLDFSAGRFSRAPLVLRNMGLEWVFRLYQEPRRLFSRYIWGNIAFLFRTITLHRQAVAAIMFVVVSLV